MAAGSSRYKENPGRKWCGGWPHLEDEAPEVGQPPPNTAFLNNFIDDHPHLGEGSVN